MWAFGGQDRPYKAPHAVTAKNKSYGYFIRKYSNTMEAKGREEQELLSMKSVPFDDRICRRADVEDLRKSLLGEYLKDVNSDLYEQVVSESPYWGFFKRIKADGRSKHRDSFGS